MRVPMLVSLALAGCSVGVGSGGAAGSDPSSAAGPHGASLNGPKGGGEEQQARTLEFSWHGSAMLPGMRGLVMQPGGENASVGMGDLTCTVSTLTGDYTDDDDYLPDDEDPQDWDDDDDGYGDTGGSYGDTGGDDDDDDDDDDEGEGNRLLMMSHADSTVGVRTTGGVLETWSVPFAARAAFVDAGILVYSESAMGCRLTLLGDGGGAVAHDLPFEACDATMAVDRATGTAWLANGDLWSVALDGTAKLAAENVGDLVTFEPTLRAPVTAFRGGTEVSVLGHWTTQTQYPVRALSNLQEVGAVLVLTEGASAGAGHLVGFEAGWGGAMGDQPAPGVDATLAVDGDGVSVGMVMDGQAVFYNVRAR